MTERPLPRSTPSAQGVRAEGIAAFLDVLESDPRIDPHGLVVVRHGSVIAEGWWAPYTADRQHLLYSMSKTFLSTAVGFAVAEGLFGLDDHIVDHFPEFEADITGPRSRRMRVRDALAMSSGHLAEMMLPAFQTDPREPVRGFLLHEPEQEPGSVFAYNQPANYSVAAVLQRTAGTDLVSYLRPRLLDPLGIGPVSWQEYPPGRSLGFSGLHATTEAIAKLCLLHLQDGVWEGEQVLPAGWAAEVRQPRIPTPNEGTADWQQGYGYQVWIARHGYRGDGAFGQLGIILPEQDVVIATTMATEQVQVVLDAAWRYLLPAFTDAPLGESAAADAALAARLTTLELPPTTGAPQPSGPDDWAGEYRAAGEVPFTARLERSADGWQAALHDTAVRLTVPVGLPGWTVLDDTPDAPPVGVSGGWAGEVLHIDLAFLESPHRLRLELRAADRSVTLHWGAQPLGAVVGESPLNQWAPRPFV